jgi:hypothetical protein
MAKNYYRSGDHNLTCDVCGKKMKASETLERWDGFRVCRDDWEQRQPQDFVKARQDKISVPFSRPQAPTPFSIPVGWQDIVSITEEIVGTRLDAYREFFDNITIADGEVFVVRLFKVDENIPVSEQLQATFDANLNPVDRIVFSETGTVCYLDYVDNTYFANVYVVGHCEKFPTALFKETITPVEVGVIVGDPYVDPTYFASNYVGSFTYFNP